MDCFGDGEDVCFSILNSTHASDMQVPHGTSPRRRQVKSALLIST